ncbi:MAG TPA: MFS transporter, partial [Cellvibrionaceae bacterium]|nr:MFS transporter [Cellvibrionaceae bacterium]
YFAVLGAMVPYWSLYLHAREFNPAEIGILLAIPTLTKIMVPNLWGYIADRSGHYKGIIVLGALGAWLAFSGIYWAQNFAAIILVMTLYSAFWNAILPQFEALTLHSLAHQPESYTRIRLWGSLGFIALVLGLGWLFDRLSVLNLPIILTALITLLCVVCVGLPPVELHRSTVVPQTLKSVMADAQVRRFFVSTLLYQASHGIYYGFYSIYLHQHGYSASVIGALWTLGVAAEIVLFWWIPKVLPSLNLPRTAQLCMLVAAVRWTLIGFTVDYWPCLILLQLLHAVTFGLFHASSVQFIRQSFGPALQGQGQALYGAIGYGAGGALGLWLCGLLWQIGSQWAFVFAVSCAFLAAGVQRGGVWQVLKKPPLLTRRQNRSS